MNSYKYKFLHEAVLASVAAIVTMSTCHDARAVHINPDGLGQLLFYPYYTVRNGNVTAMSIVNTTSLTKAVKVRFLEGKNGREVLDFNLFLSPTDVWTGVVLPTTDGARLETGDNSCVTPSDLFGNVSGEIRNDAAGRPINVFSNSQYTGANVDDPEQNALDRTREGYVEVFEMGIVADATMAGFIKHAQSGSSLGLPSNCGALDAYEGLSTAALPAVKLPGNYLVSPGGGLTGRASIINSATGTNFTYDITALDGWWAPLMPGPGNVPYSAPGVTTPSISLQAGIDTVSYVAITANPVAGVPPGVVRAVWATPREAVSAVLMRNGVINAFLTDAGTVSKTDWVITMPTKRDSIVVGRGIPNRPFSNNFANDTRTGACDAYTLNIFNREAIGIGLPFPPGTIFPFGRPSSVVSGALCWQVNVLEFAPLTLLGSTNSHQLPGAARAFGTTGAISMGVNTTFSRRTLQGPNGWAMLIYGGTGATQTQQSITPLSATLNGVAIVGGTGTHFGLPIIGAMFHNYTNTGVASSYGGVIPHKYTRNIDAVNRGAP